MESIKRLTEDNGKFIKYICAGVTSLVVDNGVFWIAYHKIGITLFFSSVLALSSGFVVSFIINRIWVFEANKESHNSTTNQIVLYTILFAFNTLFTYYFIRIVDHSLNIVLAKLIATALIACWNYIIYKKIIFKAPEIY